MKGIFNLCHIARIQKRCSNGHSSGNREQSMTRHRGAFTCWSSRTQNHRLFQKECKHPESYLQLPTGDWPKQRFVCTFNCISFVIASNVEFVLNDELEWTWKESHSLFEGRHTVPRLIWSGGLRKIAKYISHNSLVLGARIVLGISRIKNRSCNHSGATFFP
jgi:hypothetical protein